MEVQILDDTSKQITNTNETVTTTAVTVTEMTQLKAKLLDTLTTAPPSTLGAPILEVQAAI